MSGSVSQIPSSPEVRRLRQLVGIEPMTSKTSLPPTQELSSAGLLTPTSNATTGQSRHSKGTTQTTSDQPNVEELLALLQKQDMVMSELFRELETCKSEIQSLKQDSETVGTENRRLFDKLRVQIAQNSGETEDLDTLDISGLSKPLKSISGSCPACEKLQERLILQRKEQNSLKDRCSDLNSQLENGHKRDLEAVQKVQEAVDVAEKTSVALAEAELIIKNLNEALEAKSNELSEATESHRKALNATRETVTAEYRTEIEFAKKQVAKLETEVQSLQDRLDFAQSCKNEVITEKEKLNKSLLDTDMENRNVLSKLRSEYESVQSEKISLSAEYRSLEQKLSNIENLNKQKLQNMEEKCEYLNQALTDSKAEVSECKNRWLRANEEKAKLERQLILTNEELKKSRTTLEIFRQDAENEIRTSKMGAFDLENQKRLDVEHLVSKQDALVSKLKHECAALTEELARKDKEQRKSVKVLNREKRRLESKLEQISLNNNNGSENSE